MDEKTFVEKMKTILDNEDISINSSLDEIEEWDSLSVISYLAMANSSFNRKPSPEEIKNCSSIRDLYLLLQ